MARVTEKRGVETSECVRREKEGRREGGREVELTEEVTHPSSVHLPGALVLFTPSLHSLPQRKSLLVQI